MAKGEIITARIERIAAGGAGIARHEGKVCFVEFSAPGDLVRFRISEERRGWARGEITEILEPSPKRREPFCGLYGRCGGCSLQHIAYEAQLSAKEDILIEAFTRIGGAPPPLEEGGWVRPSPPRGYRNRVQFHCLPSNRRRLGFKARHRAEILPLTDCPIADPAIGEALRGGGLVPPPEKDRFTVYGRGDFLLSEGGTRRGMLSLKGKEILLDAGVFFQSNAVMLEALLDDLTALAAGADKALGMADLYCGVGTFAFFLGRGFGGLDLVEENKTALALARENLTGEAFRGESRFYALSGDSWAKTRGREPRGKAPWGFMVLDPPREGLSAPLRQYLAREGPERLAYVSCDPATAARDSGELTAAGYILKKLYFYDFYPQTAHIESLSFYTRSREEGYEN
jgi:23S rRNA (uracil1939-C5)-methyltransferase